jgi:protoporphyrinogen oxidase
MNKVKYLILGAGPTGLAFAHTLLSRGETSFLVLEQEEVAGGLCRSQEVDGAPLDIGGGHFLDLKQQRALDLLFCFLPRGEWQEFTRKSTIRLRGREIDHPLEANLWQLPLDDQVDFLESVAQAGCVRGEPIPESFEAWITWKLGERIAREYMLPYNRKIWSLDLDRLGTYWLYKLPGVSFRETLRSCLERASQGTLPAHGTFLYPVRHGYGEVWKRMGDALGERLLTGTPVTSVDPEARVVNGAFRGERIITSIPWPLWDHFSQVPDHIRTALGQLEHAAIDVDYVPETLSTPSHWCYEPDERLSYHRILCRSNFCPGSRGYWTETNSRRSAEPSGWRHHNRFAYPLNTREKPAAIAEVIAWGESKGIYSLGRWGTWEHMNSDMAVLNGIAVAERLLESDTERIRPWPHP